VNIEQGQQVRLPGELRHVTVDGVLAQPDGGLRLYVVDGTDLRPVSLDAAGVARLEVLTEDGNADPAAVLGALWSEWMHRVASDGKVSAPAASPLVPYPHQNRAVYGAMLPQPELRFLLADEPGTGKTIMGGLWLREMQPRTRTASLPH
jgi:hypothetical protein